jgi:hypothetical protein
MNKVVSHFDSLLDQMIECAERPFSFKEPKRSDELLAIIDQMRQNIGNMNKTSKNKSKPSDKPKQSHDDDGRRLEDMVRLEDEEEDPANPNPKSLPQDRASTKRALIRKSAHKKTPFDDQLKPKAPEPKPRFPALSPAQHKPHDRDRDKKNSSFDSRHQSTEKLPTIKSNESFAEEEKKYKQKKREFNHPSSTEEAAARKSHPEVTATDPKRAVYHPDDHRAHLSHPKE